MSDPRRPDWRAHRRAAEAEDYAFLIAAGATPEDAAARSGYQPDAVARAALRHPDRQP